MPGGDLRNQRKDSALLRAEIVELRDQGLSFRTIAAQVGRSLHVTWDHYQAAMREIPAANVKQHQENAAKRLDEQLRRIDMEREIVMEVATAEHPLVSNGRIIYEITDFEDGKPVYGDALTDKGPNLAAVDRLHKLDDQEARLLGLYPKVQVSVRNEPSEVDDALAALFEESDAQVARWEKEIHGDRGA
jgi:transposase-like protein